MHDHSVWMPHGYCFQWDPLVTVLWVLGNGLTALCYAAIPLQLWQLRRARPDLIPRWVAAAFGGFIAACGVGHVVSIVTLWHPAYLLLSAISTATGLVSVPAVIGLAQTIRATGRVATAAQVQEAMLARGYSSEEALSLWGTIQRSADELRYTAAVVSGRSDG